jgi:hypothetical protein
MNNTTKISLNNKRTKYEEEILNYFRKLNAKLYYYGYIQIIEFLKLLSDDVIEQIYHDLAKNSHNLDNNT